MEKKKRRNRPQRASYEEIQQKYRREEGGVKHRKRNRRKGLLFYPVLFFRGIANQCRRLASGELFKSQKMKLILAVGAVFVVCAFIVFFATKKNAYAIYVGDEFIMNIPLDKTITDTALLQLSANKLQSELQTKVKFNETLTLKKVHAPKKEIVSVDVAVGKIYHVLTYQLESAVISVNGAELIYLKNKQEADDVLEKVKKQYIATSAKVVSEAFVEDVQTKMKFVQPEKLSDVDKAFDTLTQKTKEKQEYTVQKNDSLYKIMNKMGMTKEEILEINPGVTEKSVLKIGQVLNVSELKPIVSVKTVEEVETKAPVETTVETRENPLENKKYNKVLQDGKNGEKTITERITKINDQVQSKEVANEVITTPPQPKVVEVGTRG